jgi:dTDP-4-dehydrorhamnose reductase
MRYLVAGGTGQLGRDLTARLGNDVVWSGGSDELDVRDAEAVSRVVRGARPDVVINAASYNHVDGAESNATLCFGVNSAGPHHLAWAAREAGALMVQVSTDYVFDGMKPEPYVEEDCPRPLSVYGVSKLAGELSVIASGCPYLVVRTSGLIGKGGSRAKGGSFIERIMARARAGLPLRVVADQVFSPTFTPDLAEALVRLVDRGARGTYHVTNSGSCTWHGLASAALKEAGLDVPVQAIRTVDLGAAARRPMHSILSKQRYEALGLPPLRPWSEALKDLLTS